MWETFIGLLHLFIFPGGLFALCFGLLLKGLDRRMNARLQRRIGPPLLQPALDIAKLCTKEILIPKGAAPKAFLAAPVLAFGGAALCAALVPVPGVTQGLPFAADLLVLLYCFPLPAIALMLAGSASASPFGGLGFSRETLLMLAYELPLILIVLAVALRAGALMDENSANVTFSLASIVEAQWANGSFGLDWRLIPALLAWLAFLPGTMGVPPFDIPEAETELLEGPLLEYSGAPLALFHLATALKNVVVLGLGVVLFFPGTIQIESLGSLWNGLLNLGWFMLKCALFMFIGLTLARASSGRMRVEQALRFFLTWPLGLALLSLLLVWLTS